jgi:hypothetical protein
MRNTIRFLLIAVLFVPLTLAQSSKTEANLGDHPFQADFRSGSQLTIHVRSGDVRVIGRDGDKVSVKVDTRDPEKAKEIRVRFERSGNSAELNISGGPKNDTRITIEIPKSTGLFVRMPAGQLEIIDIKGDKDVELHAGELILGVGDAADYSQVDASVTTGGIAAPPFGEEHGGLFRSFHKSGNGKYKLHAHVGAGDLTMR